MQRDGETSLETWLVPFTCYFLSPFPLFGFYSVCCYDFILVSNDLPLLFPPHTLLRICLAAVCKPRESPEGRDGSSLLVTLNAFPRSGWLPPAPALSPQLSAALCALRRCPTRSPDLGPGAGASPGSSPSPGAGPGSSRALVPVPVSAPVPVLAPAPAGRGDGRGGRAGSAGGSAAALSPHF